MSSVLIVTRTRNRPHLLRRAMGSVLAQTHSDWHHVIVNDGGKKSLVEAEIEAAREDYGDRVTLVHHAKARGMQDAANAGIAAAESVYLAIHDDDDTWAPDFLEHCVGFLEKAGPDSNYQGVITKTEMVVETVTKAGEIEELSRRPYIPLTEVSLFRMGFENPFPPIAFCFRRAAFEAVGPYDPRFTVAGDYDFNLRFAGRFEIGVVDAVAAFYHVREKATRRADKNSITAQTSEHKLRYNELKNEGLREAEASQPGSLAVALNTARYLVEIEWATHENRKRLHDLPPLLEALREAVDTHAKNLWDDQHAQHRATLQLLEETLARATSFADAGQRIATDQKNLWKDGRAQHEIEVQLLERLLQKGDQSSAHLDSLRQRLEAAAKQIASEQKNLWKDGRAQHEIEVKLLERLLQKGDQSGAHLDGLRQRLEAADQQHKIEVQLLERLLQKGDQSGAELAATHKQIETARQAVFDELNRLFQVTGFDAREARLMERFDRLAEQTAGDHRNFWVDLNERTGELSRALAALHKSFTADLTLRSQEFSRSLHQLHDTLATANANLWRDTNQRSRELLQAVEAHGENLSARLTAIHQNSLEPLALQLAALARGVDAAHQREEASRAATDERLASESAHREADKEALRAHMEDHATRLNAVSEGLGALEAAHAAETSILSLGPLRLTWRRKPKSVPTSEPEPESESEKAT